MNNNKMTVSGIINDALSIVSKHPMILLIFLLPAIISLIGGMAIAGGTGAFGALDNLQMEDGEFNFSEDFGTGYFAGLIGLAALFSIVVSIISIFVGAIAIAMTADAWEGRDVDLTSAFDYVKDKWLILIVAAILLAILQFIGVLACCIGYVIVVIVTVFVRQGIVLDNLGLTESFSYSYNLAKKVWPDILILYIIALIASVILGLIPFLGGFLGEIVTGFFTVAFTLYYLGLTHAPPSGPIPAV
ncbi:MAG: hypothetical protein JW825_01615 [Candidatus Methanofastidiosa archaeon]|nr:hypothetical protein [Candidatus Methanofastidiosa archaeon]